jgi:hypothetical protein
MKQSEIKYRYYVKSSIKLDKRIKSIIKQTNCLTGKINYFLLKEDHVVEKELPSKEIEKKVWGSYQGYIDLEIGSKEIQIIKDEYSLEINSKIKLNLEEFNAEKKEIK